MTEGIQDNNQIAIHDAMRPWQKGAKRIADVLGSLIAIVLFSPAFVWTYFRVKRDGVGPVIFCQERIGLGGRPFVIYKFRTMTGDEENEDRPELAGENEERLTPCGRYLRDHHLDELPQLFNVLKGDMSLVGPRPERRYFIEQIMRRDPRYACLYSLRPGLTSEATLRNGYADTLDKMLRRLQMDLDYLQTRTLTMDLRIILQTLIPFLKGKKI